MLAADQGPCGPWGDGTVREAAGWGTLGEPAMPQSADLLRVVHARRATVRQACYRSGAQVPEHVHAAACIVYGVGGPCFELSAARTLSKGRLNFHPAGYTHSLTYGGATNVVVIELDPDCASGLAAGAQSRSLPAACYAGLWKLLIALADDASVEVVDRALDDLIGKAEAWFPDRHPDLLGAALRRMHDDWWTPPSAQRLADELLVSTGHLCRMFRSHLDMTLRQYGLLLRLDRARELLWSTSLPLRDVAADAGFADQSHLTRALLADSGTTPRRFRAFARRHWNVAQPIAERETVAAA
jgi:AraC-like DNA-binding protein/quercetin dioxygenase-like cupin family protein